MKKLFILITLLVVVGGGKLWAGYSTVSENGVIIKWTWDFSSNWETSLYNITHGGWSATSNTTAERNFSSSAPITYTSSGTETEFSETNGLLATGTLRTDVSTNIVMFMNSSIQIPVTKGSSVKITGKSVGADRTFTWSNVESVPTDKFSTINSTTVSAIAANGGYVTLSIPQETSDRHFVLEKIEVYTPTISYGDNSGKTIDYWLADLNFTEPIPTVTPSTANIVYTTSNSKIAKMNEMDPDDILFINTGLVGITATVEGTGISDTYNVRVMANTSVFAIDGNRCYLPVNNPDNGESNKGKLGERRVTGIPYMTMQFGDASNSNTVIVREESGMMAAAVIDENGWTHTWMGDNGIPYQGTFYIFEPTVDGTLTVNGVLYGNDVTVLVDATNSMNQVGNAISTTKTPTSFSLTGGHKYYLYGKTEAAGGGTGWCRYLLHEFSYVPSVKFVDSSNNATEWGRTTNGATSYNGVQLTGQGSSTVTYSTEVYGNVSAVSVGTNGVLSSISYSGEDKGGAVVVHALIGGVKVGTYVLTIPYLNGFWDFSDPDFTDALERKCSDHSVGITADQLNANNDNWKIWYKVRLYTDKTVENPDRVLKYLQASIYCNEAEVKNTNADYISASAGLLITAPSRSMGANATCNFPEGSTLEDQLNASKDKLVSASMLTLQKGAVLTIPDLKAGQFVKMHWNRYSDNNGQFIKTTNLTDLNDVEITAEAPISIAGYRESVTGHKGSFVFKVIKDGDVSFEIADSKDNGWLTIYQIEVTTGYWQSEMHLVNDKNIIFDLSNTGVVHNGSGTTVNFWGGSTSANCARVHPIHYSVETVDGNVEASISPTQTNASDDKEAFITINSGVGSLKVVQKVYDLNDTYLIDEEETYFAVGLLEQQSYPYTWDFTKYNTLQSTGPYTTRKSDAAHGTFYGSWNSESKNCIQTVTTVKDFGNLDKQKPLFASGSQLTVGTNTIDETKGLGVGLTNGVLEIGNTGISLNGSNLRVNDVTNGNPVFTIPGLTTDMYVFVKGTAPSSVVNLTETDYYTSPTDVKVYKASSNGNVTLNFTSQASIDVIGVTNLNKVVNKYGYTTESRSRVIDHSYTSKSSTDGNSATNDTGTGAMLTGYEVKAYAATSFVDSNNTDGDVAGTISLTETYDRVGADVGVVMKSSNAGTEAESTTNSPLFVPPCNRNAGSSITGTNLLKPAVGTVTIGEYDGDNINFVLTNVYYKIHKDGTASSGMLGGSDTSIGFYRLGKSGSFGPNKAYLQIAKGSFGAKGAVLMSFDPIDLESGAGIATAVDRISVSNDTNDDSIYYNLNGQKLNGKPSQRGIYIKNGKKIFVK